MNPKKLSSLLVLLPLLAASAQAATITWSSAINVTSSTDVSTTGTLVGARNFGGVDTTFNTVAFSSNTTAWGGGAFTSYGSPTVGGADATNYAAALNTGKFFGAASTTYSASLDLASVGSNLVIGQEYQIQVWFNDSRAGQTALNCNMDLDGGAGQTQVTIAGGSGTNGQYAIGTFTADATSQTLRVTGSPNGGPTMNMMQLRAIPEPSAALLGGLGALCLLRRRRA